MKQIQVNGITYQVGEEDELPHQAVALFASDELSEVHVPEFVTVDDFPYPVLALAKGFLSPKSKATKVFLPSTLKKAESEAFPPLSHPLVLSLDKTEIPPAFEKGWNSNVPVVLKPKGKVEQFFTPVATPPLSLKVNVGTKEKKDGEEEEKKASILTAEGLRQHAKKWNGKTIAVIFVVGVVAVVLLGVLLSLLKR